MGAKNAKHLLISIPKCIELNSESKPQFDFGLSMGPHLGLRPNTFFYKVKCLATSEKMKIFKIDQK